MAVSSSSLLHCGVKLVALFSLLFGIGIFGLSSWILHKSLQMKKNHELNGKEFLSQVNTFFGGAGGSSGPGLYDLDLVFRILISTSASALTGGAFQVLFSLVLFLATIKGGHASRLAGKVWVYMHVLIMLTIGSATLCILTNELELNPPIRIFLISTGTDALLIIFFMWVVYTQSFTEDDDERRDSKGVIGYHNPPGYATSLAQPQPNKALVLPVDNFKDVKLRPVSVV